MIFDSNRNTTQARTQQERKKVKARRGENRNRFVHPCSFYLQFIIPWNIFELLFSRYLVEFSMWHILLSLGFYVLSWQESPFPVDEIQYLHCLSLSRGLSAASLLSSSGVTPPSSSATLSQPIIISDTPSPAVSIITIHSDTDTEDERKFHPARFDSITRPRLHSFRQN